MCMDTRLMAARGNGQTELRRGGRWGREFSMQEWNEDIIAVETAVTLDGLLRERIHRIV